VADIKEEGTIVMKKLENLEWNPKWVSHLGCVKGCLEYFGRDVSAAWLFGATGHAFVINIHEVVCPSGPTAWNTEMLSSLGKNLGYEVDGVFSHRGMDNFEEIREKAWELVKKSIGEGNPCYGWELSVPEYYIVNGYDDDNYHFSGPIMEGAKDTKPWKELGESEIGVIAMHSVNPCEPADDAKTVKDALAFALEHATSPEKWIFPKYKAGLDGFDLWMKALETNTAHGMGMAYNAEVWSECRGYAVDFLKEAKERLGNDNLAPLFDEAISHYDVVARHLKSVQELFPFLERKDEHIQDESRRAKAIEALKAARAAEAAGLKSLERIAAEL